MPEYTLIEEKIETALKGVVEDATSGIDAANILKGHDTATKTVNYVVCMYLSAVEDRQVPGNWTVRARVGVFGNPDDGATPLASFNTQCAKISDQLMQHNLGALLSAKVADFYVYDPPLDRRKVPDFEGRKWVRWFELDLYCLCLDA